MIPAEFLNRMEKLLGDEFPRFRKSLENEDAVRAVRINTLKTDQDTFIKNTRLPLDTIPYAEDGFILGECDSIGSTPEHHSGMIYVQDPGAMAPLNALDIKDGWRVLDMCAAPGGKSGQAAAKIGDTGFLHSNEFVPKRAKITVGNFERLGIKNAIVTSLDTKELTRLYSTFFDLVITDAPCSGEGMFRKSEEAREEWSDENVRLCKSRQKEILENAAHLTKDGGYLIYSTCTYSLEENEEVIDEFLSEHEDYKLIPVKDELKRVTSDGICFEGAKSKNLDMCRRFYPHMARGEGQFMALLKRTAPDKKPTLLYKDSARPPSKDELAAVEKFFKSCLKERPDGKILKVGESLVIISHGLPIPPRSVFSSGVLLGNVEKGLLFPSHQFFSAYGKLFKEQENLTRGDSRIEKYLHGEEIEAKEVAGNGWCTILFEGAPIGGGKASCGKIKNHYPKGLRNKG